MKDEKRKLALWINLSLLTISQNGNDPLITDPDRVPRSLLRKYWNELKANAPAITAWAQKSN